MKPNTLSDIRDKLTQGWHFPWIGWGKLHFYVEDHRGEYRSLCYKHRPPGHPFHWGGITFKQKPRIKSRCKRCQERYVAAQKLSRRIQRAIRMIKTGKKSYNV